MKLKDKSLLQNFSWTFIGSLVYSLSQWLLVVILAKLGSPEVVGQFTLGLAITAPVILFSNMQLRNILATDSVNEYSFSQYFGTRIFLLIIAILAIVCITTFGPYGLSVSMVIMLVGLSKAVESLSELTHGYFQKIERMDYAGKSQIYKALSSLISFVILYMVSNNLILALVGLNIAWIFRLLFYDLKIMRKYTDINPVISSLKKIIIFSLPLGIVSVINSLNTNIPRYFLERSSGLEELGYFSAISYILIAGNLLIRPLSLVVAPRLAECYQSGEGKKFVRITTNLMMVALGIGVLGLLIVFYFGEFILTIIYDSTYANYNDLFFLIMIGSVFSYFTTFLNSSIVAAREFKKQPFINIITMVVGLITSIILIPDLGIVGAGYVTVIVFLTQFIGSLGLLFVAVKRIKRK